MIELALNILSSPHLHTAQWEDEGATVPLTGLWDGFYMGYSLSYYGLLIIIVGGGVFWSMSFSKTLVEQSDFQ